MFVFTNVGIFIFVSKLLRVTQQMMIRRNWKVKTKMSPLYLSLQHTDSVLRCDISLAIQREAGDMSLRGRGARRLDSRERAGRKTLLLVTNSYFRIKNI